MRPHNHPHPITGDPMCQELTEGVRELCPGLEYNSTFFPNSLGHADQEEAFEMLSMQLTVMNMDCPAGVC